MGIASHFTLFWNHKGEVTRMKNLSHLRISILIIIILCSTASAWDIENGIIREWPVDGVRPYASETLTDGSVWFTSDNDPSVFTFNTEMDVPIVYTAPFDGDFATIARAPDDTLWISDENDRIVHFRPCDPSGDYFDDFPIPRDLFPPDAAPYGIEVAPDGMVWFTRWPDPSLGRYNPSSDSWSRFELPLIALDDDGIADDYPGTPALITFDDDGNVWFTLNELFPVGGKQGRAGFGKLDLSTNTFTLYNEPERFTADLRAPWEIRFTSYNPDILWFTDKSANYLVKVDLSGPDPDNPVIEEYETPYTTVPPMIWDTHFFAIDPDGIFWLAPFFTDNIGTFNPTTHVFEARSLMVYGSPFSIVMSPIGEVWWAIPGGLGGEQRGVGRFIPFIDTDGDGIDDGIDGAPAVPSGTFSDGLTSGALINAGNQRIVITDATAPFGIRMISDCSGGANPALISCCDPLVQCITMTPCDDILVTRGDNTIRVIAGPVDIELGNGAVITAFSRSFFRVTDNGGGTYRIDNIGCPDTGSVTVGTHTVVPGESLTFTPPVAEANGPYTRGAGQPVFLSSAGSMDPDPGDTITYQWDFQNDGITDSILPNPSYTYPTWGIYTARLTVTDSYGLSAMDTATVTINRAPVITSFTPAT